jgi:hypothetical protein
LILEITNVASVDTITQFENDVPREITVYTLYPGARLSVINADTYDTINTESGLPYERWYIYLASGESIPITDNMQSSEITLDMMSIYADGRIAGTTVLLFVMYNEAQYVPQMRPTFLSPNMGLEALKPLIYGSDGWGIDAQGDYIFAHFWRYVLRYDAKTNKIDKIIDLGEAPEYWYYAATFSPDGQSCVAQASEFDGPGRTHKMLIDLKNETAVPTEQEFFPHSIERNLNSVRLRGFGDEDSWWLGDAEDNPISGPIKALQPYATMAAQTIIIDKNRVGAILPSDAGWDALGYYKFAVIDLAQDRIVQECPMNVLKPGETLSLYPSALELNETLLAELGMTYDELTQRYGPRIGEDGTGIQFEKGIGFYHFMSDGEYSNSPALTDRCKYIMPGSAKTLFLGLTGSIAKENLLAALNLEEPDGYGPVPRDGYKYHTVLWLGREYQIDVYHNESNAFRPDDLVSILDPY